MFILLNFQLSSPPKQSSKPPAYITEKNEPKVDLNKRLNNVINSSDVMLFMKGNSDQPRCGFSQKIVDILREHDVKFKTFDILNDQEVREGLKKYSNWPTYPQVFDIHSTQQC